MPELPEVETIRRALERRARGLVLRRVQIEEPRLLQRVSPSALSRTLRGRALRRVARRGKFLVLDFGRHSAVLHLRMTGWFGLRPGGHTRMTLDFENDDGNGLTLYFDDTRRFATLHLVPTQELEGHPPLRGLGLEPLGRGFTPSALAGLAGSRRAVKLLLLDQTKVAGLGNIYSCEALHRGGVHPQRPANRLSEGEIRALHRAVREVLSEAITRHGSTLGDAAGDYRTLNGAKGGFQDRFRVYGRAGEACLTCQTSIERVTLAQRSTFFCPRCQPAKGETR